MKSSTILENLERVSAQFAQDRRERQLRRELSKADFEQLRETGFLLTGVPVEQGGIWHSVQRSTRPICDMLRTLAHGDSSVALVSTMHPAVLIFWLATQQVPAPYQEGWEKQRKQIFETARQGAWWGTITSEPGSGGDIARTKTVAHRRSGHLEYALTGQKHFGSGLGITSYMITTALPEGTTTPDLFYMDMRDVAWDGSAGAELTFPWNGHGMIATQSHGMKFDDFPATRCAWPESILLLAKAATPFINCLFSSVIVGIVEIALETAREQVARRGASFHAYEQVEWSKAEMEGWLIQQALEGMLRAVEEEQDGATISLRGKTAIAELAETVTRRLCRIMGGGAYSRHSPFGFWFEDVRALGYLRPPWGLAYSNLFEGAMSQLADSPQTG